jgi:hypothetical protein
MTQAFTGKNPQASRCLELKKEVLPTVARLTEGLSASMQNLVALAVSLIQLEGEYNAMVGGETTAAILVKGQRPILVKFPAR